jgi:membrane fusion protein, multidrug efflux system
MKRSIILVLLVAAAAAGTYYYVRRPLSAEGTDPAGAGASGRGGGRQGGGGFGGGGFGGFGGGPRLPMTVDIAQVKRADMTTTLTVVGNLIGAATIEAVPKVAGRLEAVSVKLGDRVSRGQQIAKVEDHELLEQVRQAQASYEVGAATIRQREADLRLAQTNLDRSRNLFERQLIPRQTFDDTDARYQAAAAQLDLAKAQFAQAGARLDELKINVANTTITSPVSGFIGRRLLDPGAWVTPNSEFISIVDIATVRMVANIVEKDLRRVATGMKADVSVDAFPGESFVGRIARVAPVLDPATRTAQIEIEIDNPQFRLKPGMYANVNFTTERRDKALVVPTNAVVDLNGNRGVFQPGEGDTAKFKSVSVGIIDGELAEIQSGLQEGDRVVTTGAAALREGDRIVLAGQRQGGPGAGGGRGGRGRGGSEAGEGQRSADPPSPAGGPRDASPASPPTGGPVGVPPTSPPASPPAAPSSGRTGRS